jgi:hypothetical protein
MFERSILAQIQRLGPEQGRTFDKIVFWSLFLYLQVWVLGAAARDLLVAIGIGTVLVLLFRRTEAGQRMSFIMLHGAILASLAWTQFTTGVVPLAMIDLGVLATLAVLELTSRSKTILFLIAAEHGLALWLSPWSDASAMKATAVMSAHVVARVFAAVMVLAIALRPLVRDRMETAQPEPQSSQPHRPLTVAEWEARHPNK